MKSKIFTTILFILIMSLLAACQSQEPEAAPDPEQATPLETTVPPTETPIEEPTDEPAEAISEVEAEAELLDLGALTAHPWQWVSFTNPVEQYDVETPEAYLLQFNTDEIVNIVADCNNASGSYTFDGSSLTIMVGPMTMAACPEESRSDQFVALLGGAAIAFLEDGNLYIDLMVDGGTMVFAPADAEAMVEDGEGAMAGTMTSFELLDECFVDMPADIDYECGNVVVPQFHNEDNGESITLGVIRLLSTADEAAEPIFFASGGPGGSLMDSVPSVAAAVLDDDTSAFGQLLSSRDLVFFTQRGTIYADPALMCGLDYFDDYIDLILDGSTVEEREEAELAAIKTCYEFYADASVDFAAYNSVQNAADVNHIRQALGYDQIVYYGESYGTLLGQHVMRDYPEILTAVILDGAAPLDAPSWVTQMDAKYLSALDTVIALCAADEACAAAYPDLAEDVEAVYKKLQTEPYAYNYVDVPVQIDQNLAAQAIYDSFYVPSFVSNLPLTIVSMLNDVDDDRVGPILNQALPSPGTLSYMVHYATICAEDPVTSLDDALSLDSISYSVIDEFLRSDTYEYSEMCAYFDLPLLPDETDEPISSDLPVLILSGAFDPITPPLTAAPITETLPNSFAFAFPYGGHVQFLTGNNCAQSVVLAFLDDPMTEPESSCIAESEPLQFSLPAEESDT